MDSTLANGLVALCISLFLVSYYLASLNSKRPPGPRQLPFIGNAHQVPKEHSWVTFAKWQRIYGDIIYLDLVGQPALIINSRKVTSDLLEKRSTIYSDRPRTEMIKLCEFSEVLTLQQYGDNLRKQRRFVAPDFALSYVHNYATLQEEQMTLLVRNVLKDPSALSSELKLRIGKIILRATYGYDVKSEDDAFLKSGLEAVDNFSIITAPGAWPVDLVPILRFLPRWMPGSRFLTYTEQVKKRLLQACWEPYLWCKDNMNTDRVFQPNMISNIIRNAGADITGTNDERQAAWAGLTMLGGGLDTKISTILTFLLCMILNPDVQKKAQAEIDAVVGKARLPLISDRENLPYVRSVLAETYRWSPALPLCVPHVLSKDDVYEGYVLKKGTTIIPNIWAMFHDPEIYPDPMAFKPERFNGDDAAMDKINIVFGFGRRICSGRYLAEGTLFTTIATFLATCDILPGLDANGKEITPNPKYGSGTISTPEMFPVRFKPRSAQAETLLAETYNLADE